MAAVASAPPWNPEDDLLLKNAMEAGASLEALAKGAVRFSRKFTVRELRERWHSLLYDTDVSAEASARMLEFELCNSSVPSKSNRFGNSRDLKRKVESIRKQYHAMRKRMRIVNSFYLNFRDDAPQVDNDEALDANVMDKDCFRTSFVDCNADDGDAANVFHARDCVELENHVMDGVVMEGCSNGFSEQVSLLSAKGLGENAGVSTFGLENACEDLSTRRDNSIDFGNSLDADDLGPSHVFTDMPLWKTIEDVLAPEMPINGEDAKETLVVPEDVDGENTGPSQYEVNNSEAMLNDGGVGDELNRSVAISGGDYAEISDSLWNLTNEDDESLNSILLSSPKDVHEDDVPDFCQPQKLVSDSCQSVSDNVHTAEMDVAAEPSHSVHDDQRDISCSEANMSSATSVPNPLTPKLHDEWTICTLNTEDPEIPCNDDIFFPTAIVHTVVQPSFKEASDLASCTDQRNCDQQMITLKKEEDPAQPFKAPRMVGQDTITENSPNQPKPTFRDSSCVASVSKHDKNVHADPRQCRSAHATPKSISNGVLKEEGINGPVTVTELAPLTAESGSTKMTFPEPEANRLALDCEESEEESDDDVDDDGDADIPYFSDIETMILEMDLCPHDQESDISREVSKYQHQHAKRKIMRLEQCAQSSMQRALASKGALAVMYGRHLKQYIKKTEVILGRATEDNEVDIDLGKEGLANKISRRQALIKMEGDGSFSLKNLGKSSIFLNGKEVATGQLLSLSSSNLIEIRGMSFVFEMNHKSVRQYLAKIAKKSEDKYTKFEWSPEGGP